MASYNKGDLIERVGDQVWIKTTPGRLNSFLAFRIRKEKVAPQSKGAADDLLRLLEDAAAEQAK